MELKKILEQWFSKGEQTPRKDLPQFTRAKMRLASHPEAKEQTLSKLSQHDWECIVARVAENTNTPVEVLIQLATHEHPEVRTALTENPKTPEHILIVLAVDEHVDVRYCLAENPNVPPAVLAILCKDENPYVADRAKKTLARLQQTRFSPTGWFPFMRQENRDLG